MQNYASAPAAAKDVRHLNTRALLLAFMLVMLLLVGNFAVMFESIRAVKEHQQWVTHTWEVVAELEMFQSDMKDVEGSQRGFALAESDNFLTPHRRSRRSAVERMRRIRELTGDNPAQEARLNELAAKQDEAFRWHDQVLNVRREEGLQKAAELIATEEGVRIMEELRRMTEGIADIERRLLAQRSLQAEKASDRVDLTLFLSTAVSLLLASLTYYFVRSSMLKQQAERERVGDEAWQASGLADLGQIMREDQALSSMADRSLEYLAQRLGAQVGSFFVFDRGDLSLVAAFGRTDAKLNSVRIKPGEGLVGEALKRQRLFDVENIPSGYLKVGTSLGDAEPKRLLILPLIFEGQIAGVIELGTLNDVAPRDLAFLDEAQQSIASSVLSAVSRQRMQELLEETQRQSEELQTQQEELRSSNEELETQASALRSSQDRLQMQQEELRQTNEELEQQTKALDNQRSILADQNLALMTIKRELETKAKELEQSSRYKSEFLSNMSHELRTPLNSLLLLSTLLGENKEGRLSQQQVDWAKTISQSGNDLLTLINDILDLSKVEAGKIEITPEDVKLEDVLDATDRSFRHLAEHKGLKLELSYDPALPKQLRTDRLRLEQILKNLLSNAIKFTAQGEVSLELKPRPNGGVAFVVRDTGIGIPSDKKDLIFEAFQQADGSTSRSHGGTGLGLTISRELARLLGGEVEVESEVGVGSTFTLVLPPSIPDSLPERASRAPKRASVAMPQLGLGAVAAKAAVESVPIAAGKILGDVDDDDKSKRRVLIVEDDVEFGKALIELAHESGFRAVLATSGSVALAYVDQHSLDAVLLDMKLPDLSGLVILERLKHSPKTRHIPVHVISALDFSQNALSFGAAGYLRKPASRDNLAEVFKNFETLLSRRVRRVLVVEDDKMQREAIRHLLGNGDLLVDEAGTAADALRRLSEIAYDCVILDLRLPDMSGFELLEEMKKSNPTARVPVVVYTGKDLSRSEQDRLEEYAESIIIKGARSPERLLDEVSLFLHRLEDSLPPDSRALLQRLRTGDTSLQGRRVLIVDDDMRNVYALVASLEAAGMKTAVARNGSEALSKLGEQADIDLVLMDIMMPIMDGYEAMRRIREDNKFKRMPIIALTAKAMRGDVDSCLAAGANDYLSKPVQLEQLLSLIKVWMPRYV